MKIEEKVDEIVTRVAMIEILLEVAYANTFSSIPKNEADEAKARLIHIAGTPGEKSRSAFLDSRRFQMLAQRVRENMKRFMEGVSEREADIRETNRI